MQTPSPGGAASHDLDTVRGERQRSAALAVHLAWLDHVSALGRGERIEPNGPVDLPTLYRAAAATFEPWPPAPRPADLPAGGRISNRLGAARRLSSVADEGIRLLATLFAHHVITLSANAPSEQDLDSHVELFLRGVQPAGVIDNIVSGAIGKNSSRLTDPDLW